VLLHYSGGWPVPRAASLSSGGLCIYTNIYINVGCLYPFILLILYLQTSKPQAIMRSSSFRVVDEHSYRQEISLPVIQNPGFRAPEISRCEPYNRVTEPKFYFLYGSHGHGQKFVRYNIRLILILCGRIVHGPQCKMFLIYFYNSAIFLL